MKDTTHVKSEKYEYLCSIDFNMVKNALGKRDQYSYKNKFGTLICLCGSRRMTGAAIMSSMAALRCGVGIVKCALPKSVCRTVVQSAPEIISLELDENDEGTVSQMSVSALFEHLNCCTATLIGCGLGRNEDVVSVVSGVLKKAQVPLVIDADGINALSKNIDILREVKSSVVITPHIGEASRLLGISSDEVISKKSKCAEYLSKKYGIVTVIKGIETIISDEKGNLFINRVPNSGMSKGGSGDVLAGMIASFLAQGISPVDSAVCGVYLHSMAGMRCKDKYSETSMLPTDLIKELPNIFLNMNR